MSEVPPDWASYYLSPTNEAIAVKLYDGIQQAMTRRGLRWRSVPRSGWIAFQRDESKSVLGIQLNSATIKMWVKLPESPEQFLRRGKKVVNPYPQLVTYWRAKDKQWEWEIPTLEAIPDLSIAIDLARLHH